MCRHIYIYIYLCNWNIGDCDIKLHVPINQTNPTILHVLAKSCLYFPIHCNTSQIKTAYGRQRINEKIVAAFRGMHVSHAKHTCSYAWLLRKCEYWTYTRTDRRTKSSLYAAMLRRRHYQKHGDTINVPIWSFLSGVFIARHKYNID